MAKDNRKATDKDQETGDRSEADFIVPSKVCNILGRVVSGEATMATGRELLRTWLAGLSDAEMAALSPRCYHMARHMSLAAEGLGQELMTIGQVR